MWQDPIVEETRKIRREIESECGNDFERLAAKAVEIQRRYSQRLIANLSAFKEEQEPIPAGHANGSLHQRPPG
jgi:hypothetical protein